MSNQLKKSFIIKADKPKYYANIVKINHELKNIINEIRQTFIQYLKNEDSKNILLFINEFGSEIFDNIEVLSAIPKTLSFYENINKHKEWYSIFLNTNIHIQHEDTKNSCLMSAIEFSETNVEFFDYLYNTIPKIVKNHFQYINLNNRNLSQPVLFKVMDFAKVITNVQKSIIKDIDNEYNLNIIFSSKYMQKLLNNDENINKIILTIFYNRNFDPNKLENLYPYIKKEKWDNVIEFILNNDNLNNKEHWENYIKVLDMVPKLFLFLNNKKALPDLFYTNLIDRMCTKISKGRNEEIPVIWNNILSNGMFTDKIHIIEQHQHNIVESYKKGKTQKWITNLLFCMDISKVKITQQQKTKLKI